MNRVFLPSFCLAAVLAGCERSPPQRVLAPAKPINGKLRVQRLVMQPAATVEPGDELDLAGTFELDDPSRSPPHGIASIVRVEGGSKTICDSQSIRPTRDDMDENPYRSPVESGASGWRRRMRPPWLIIGSGLGILALVQAGDVRLEKPDLRDCLP